MTANVAIVIPVGPGDYAWRGLLPQLASADSDEIILSMADGDAVFTDALTSNLRVIHSEAGRARQLNAGAHAARAQWLWFLHADSCVGVEAIQAMQAFVTNNEPAIGYFDLRFLGDGPRWMAINSFGAFLRSRLLGLPFGDQGLLMPRRVFESLGGFDDAVGKGEDHALIWRARAQGVPLRALGASIRTSARKYAEHGWWRTTWQHLRMTRAQALRFSRLAHSQRAGDRQ
ncbi:MAG TPA: glycosyltransferase family 2 protein [Dokdonella sp.]|uniref:TIGR04283 family arsenosugar biosynthesis glycosyltransferase n=1 Tax=Dokdonella sp. TaxID=2291710 RepID=UPI002D7FD99B|nr:glycosyltransferase family 2 protein [Dokdonella sp.]HET9031740.1 glycosyltransferase family 2 protein [Dokdonella sp.]